ncbi:MULTISPECIES: hypothetical protein [unclassified Uliginosibacterium]|uniref:hypothetical protein n=1 Tax=unclassified Uliginosibacterium TaxID=2621521 RepID=UPI000C79D629|nr:MULTISPECIES: hypothetical protein [unclassified Uliginosibacterium]MDO6387472.1 hypothetical protein [Uliginosibacterium sp. 31-12]PLK47096.1 hypothetical protein C0V76_18750 [Uliginosibacterium sp. TH139]
MKTPRQIFLALLAAASLAAPAISHAETVFERFAPPLPPVIVPRIVIGGEPAHGGYHRPPPPPPRYEYRPAREYHHHHYYHDEYRYRDARRDYHDYPRGPHRY